MSSDLRRALIRLAASNPDARPHLLPILAEVEPKKTAAWAEREGDILDQAVTSEQRAGGEKILSWLRNMGIKPIEGGTIPDVPIYMGPSLIFVLKDGAPEIDVLDSGLIRLGDSTIRSEDDFVARVEALMAAKTKVRAPKLDMSGVGLSKRRKRASREPQQVIENVHVRVTYRDHPVNSITVTEMPGKPVKKKCRVTGFSMHHLTQNVSDWFLSDNILMLAKLKSSPSMTYEDAVRKISDALLEAKDKAVAAKPSLQDDRLLKDVVKEATWTQTVSFLEIEPIDYKPIVFQGKDFGGTAKWTGFKFSLSDRDPYAEMSPFWQSTAATAARKLFKVLKADPDFTDNMTAEQFKEFLRRSKINFEFVDSVWR
jgi:hypothetical protein